ncbi:MAG: hypothetical protein JWM21_393 [Acidobacteria bacterium]|nr:hypothetical protein [Acidobacteriota bacterium]
MSDISLNLDGLIAFLAAAALGLLLLLAIVIASISALIKARRKHESFARQRLAQQSLGMLVSVMGCVVVVILLLLSERTLPPRTLSIWFDHWVVVWVAAVLALWPVSVLGWKKLRA